jgi:hypothetical protein
MDSAITSAYDDYGQKLFENGYHAHPIGPGTKEPQVIVNGQYRNMIGWQSPDRSKAPSPQPGAGVGVRLGLQRNGKYQIGIDWDHDELAIAAMDAFPSAVCKEGRRGFTSFFVSDREIPSKDFKVNGKCVVQVLSVGRQTVLPPSVHPDTGRQYVWMTDHTLVNTRIENLPELPPDYIERIQAIIEAANMAVDVEEEPKSPPPEEGYDEDGPFAALNKAAMRNLEAWVPALGLYNCRRRSGRYPSYEAVATWRPSTEGRPNEQRKPNLKISGKGIKDFGVDKGYSPLDLVMVARGRDLSAAYDWLSERVLPRSRVEIDFDAIIENAKAPSIDPANDDDDGGDDDGGGGGADTNSAKAEKEPDFSLLGDVWRFGDVLPIRPAMLVKNLIPATGYGYIAGQWGTFKTFAVNGLAVAVAGGGTFANQEVVRRGAVVMVELEGSNSEARITAAAEAADVGGNLPIVLLSHDPPKMIVNGMLNPKLKLWCNQLVAYGRKLAKENDLPLALITIDPQNKVAGFRDEQSSAEGQVVSDGWTYLAKIAGCAVVIVDHYGKDQNAGLRGTSTKETNAHYILGTSERDKNVFAPRYLEVRKQRNGVSGVCVDFRMEEYSISMGQQTDDGGVEDVDVSTLVIRWEGGLRSVDDDDASEGPKKKGPEKTPTERALDKLRELMDVPELKTVCNAPGGYDVKTDQWYVACDAAGIMDDSEDRKVAFRKIRQKLRKAGLIEEEGGLHGSNCRRLEVAQGAYHQPYQRGRLGTLSGTHGTL